ncbi:hypothetical protein BDV59DRAFT_168002 [Aspergillus ambiguus]|uniref:uncharacterized protein n=1 Tax=Aspergillus ambiguus TaxID=176160 RepID=UPI003CCCB10E
MGTLPYKTFQAVTPVTTRVDHSQKLRGYSLGIRTTDATGIQTYSRSTPSMGPRDHDGMRILARLPINVMSQSFKKREVDTFI